MRIKGTDIELRIGGAPVPLQSFSYGDVAKPAPPALVVVCGQLDINLRFVARPSVWIRDALSDRVDDIVARHSEEGGES